MPYRNFPVEMYATRKKLIELSTKLSMSKKYACENNQKTKNSQIYGKTYFLKSLILKEKTEIEIATLNKYIA